MNNQKLYQQFCFYGRQALEARAKCIGLLPEIFKRGIYLKYGFTSIHEFAAKLAGLSNEQVNRVLNLENRLADKPILHQALVQGEISMNKLRKVVAIATIENQQEVLDNIKVLSVRAVETMVKDFKNNITQDNCKADKVSKNGHVTMQSEMFLPTDQVAGEVNINGTGISKLQLDEEVEEKLLAMQQKGIDINTALKNFLKNFSRK